MTRSAATPDEGTGGPATAADLDPTWFIDSDEPSVVSFAEAHAGSGSARDKAVRLTRAVRDTIRYDPYSFRLDPKRYRASWCLAQPSAFCVPKAILLAGAARAVGIPARLGYADVRNHLASPRLAAMMGSDLFRWHGYTALFLDDRWVKATPAFDLGLCQRFGVTPLEFDGSGDSVFHPFDASGRRHMEYVHQIGEFSDFPYETYAVEMRLYYAPLLSVMEAHDAAHIAAGTPQQFGPDEH
jgi:transglutaminase-like putative cysteine protease